MENKILKMWSVVGERKEQNIKHEIWDYYYGCFSSALSWICFQLSSHFESKLNAPKETSANGVETYKTN